MKVFEDTKDMTGIKDIDDANADEMIGDLEIREAFGSIALAGDKKERIWSRIAGEEHAAAGNISASDTAARSDEIRRGTEMHAGNLKSEKLEPVTVDRSTGMRRTVRRLLAAAAVLILVIAIASLSLTVVGGGPSLQGYVYAAESRDTGMTPVEVLVDTADPFTNADIYVYGPAIYYLDEDRLIFGNDTGLVIYNLLDKKLEGLIDMQAICSGYFNSDSVKTHVFVQQDRLCVYNAKVQGNGEKPFGWYHIFDLNEACGGAELLKYSESGNDDETLGKLAAYCGEYEAEHLSDAWDSFGYLHDGGLEDALNMQGGKYSGNAYTYKGESGSVSAVLIWRGWKSGKETTDGSESDGEEAENSGADKESGFYPWYELCTAKEGDAEGADFTTIDLGIDDKTRDEANRYNILPGYKYTGSDPALKAICEYMADWDDEIEFRSVMIPAPVIYGRVQKGDELLVFGNFWSDTYVKRGNTLVTVSGGEMPACFHLEKDGKDCKVASVDQAEDGQFYLKSIKLFTKGHPLIYLKFRTYGGSGHNEKIRKQAVRDYVTANGLDIKYYKDYGWDPMPLSED